MIFDREFFVEAFGYLGTALVIISMLMTSVVKLRVINLCGSVISAVYAGIIGTWPVVLLNVSLVTINAVQLIRMRGTRLPLSCLYPSLNDGGVEYFLRLYGEDIEKYYPGFALPEAEKTLVMLAYIGSEAVGILVGERQGDTVHIALDYATPKYRDLSVSTFLFSELEASGVKTLTTATDSDVHRKYLLRMGFVQGAGLMEKQLDSKENTK